MKKILSAVLVLVLLLLPVGCTDPEKDSSAETQPANSIGTSPIDQTNSTAAPETSSPSGTETTPSEAPTFVTGDDGVDLPINPF